jgi:hypothetical protein
LVSLALVIPCFWLPIVTRYDLQSHLYNAWLHELITNGSIHGFWIGHQYTNVLVDTLLAFLLKNFGVSAAERVITTSVVLVFFWGAFSFISAVRGQSTYWLAPWLAIVTYGIVFQFGFLNFYLASGTLLWAFAIVWRSGFGWRALWALPLLFLAFFAHPVPVLWFSVAATYCWIARRLRPRFQILLFLFGAAALVLIRFYFDSRYYTTWTSTQILFSTGVDQCLLEGWRYLPVAIGMLLFSIALLGQRENRRRAMASVVAQVYALNAVAIVVLPMAIRRTMDGVDAGHFAYRLSLYSAVLLLALLSWSTFRRWYAYAGIAAVVVFFGVLYLDMGAEARAEQKIAGMVEALPYGARIIQIPGVAPLEGKLTRLSQKVYFRCCLRLFGNYLVTRACIGHCFDYDDFEPSTGQFRIHAMPGNGVVVDSFPRLRKWGFEPLQANVLPLYGLIRCGPDPGDVFLRPLAEGEIFAKMQCPSVAARQ